MNFSGFIDSEPLGPLFAQAGGQLCETLATRKIWRIDRRPLAGDPARDPIRRKNKMAGFFDETERRARELADRLRRGGKADAEIAKELADFRDSRIEQEKARDRRAYNRAFVEYILRKCRD